MISTAICYSTLETPVGTLLLTADDEGLRGIHAPSHHGGAEAEPNWQHDDEALGDVRRQLMEYFEGRRRTFSLKLSPQGTPFQQRVWKLLREIPYGTTATYGELAAQLGTPGASRAVGHANARNPVSIVVPCHRVIGANGALTGYAGGLDMKRTLLALERAEVG